MDTDCRIPSLELLPHLHLHHQHLTAISPLPLYDIPASEGALLECSAGYGSWRPCGKLLRKTRHVSILIQSRAPESFHQHLLE